MGSTSGERRTLDVRSSRLAHLWGYLAGVLLLPAAGIGLYLIWRLERRVANTRLIVEERRIRIRTGGDPRDPDGERILDVSAIVKVESHPLPPPGGWFGLGALVVHGGAGEVRIGGLRKVGHLRQAIERSIAEAGERKRAGTGERRGTTRTKPGSTDQMNELTLLWQQGLVSDEDFEREKGKFN